MSNMIDQFELDGLREDFYNLIGIYDVGGGIPSISKAKTLITISRIIEIGPLNATTKKYDSPSTTSIYAGPAHISPVTYRRDRQELGGQESIRIRQYRGIVPWDAGDIHLDDYMVVNNSQDPDVEGKVFDITDVLYVSELSIRWISFTDPSK
jgi:hypothetical protein